MDLQLALDENCDNTETAFHVESFKKRIFDNISFVVIVKEKFNSKIFLISKSILNAWGKQSISN